MKYIYLSLIQWFCIQLYYCFLYFQAPKKAHTAEAPPPDASERMTRIRYLDDDIVNGAFYTECCWFWKGSDRGAGPHTHDFDEVLTVFGTNPDDPEDLCGEVELWLGDEKHIITKSAVVFIPAGLKHCPFIVRRVDRPIFHFTVGPARVYTKEQE